MTSHMDQQSVMSAIEQLLTLNGWVAALCPTLSRPFGQSDNPYDELVREAENQPGSSELEPPDEDEESGSNVFKIRQWWRQQRGR